MNKAEFKAISMIAEKLGWQHKPVKEVCENIKKMVKNQQALELDTVGECDGDEETLLSIAIWDKDKILSTMFVHDYETMIEWNVDTFCEDMGVDYIDFRAMIGYEEHKAELLAEDYEQEEMAMYDAHCDAWENAYC